MKEVRVQLLDDKTGAFIEDVDVLTSPSSVLYEDGKSVKDKIDEVTSQLETIAVQVDENNLNDIKKYNNLLFKAGCVINSDVTINFKDNARIDFNGCTIKGNLDLSRNKNTQFIGTVNVSGDTIILGSVSNTFDIIKTNFFYLQNYVGWGGVYWNTWNAIFCKAMQVRQAKIPNSTSALNCNRINKLVAQYGLEKNNWINVWFRGEGIDHLYTEQGTSQELQGADKWDIVTCNPFEINNLDFSYSNKISGLSYGIKHEGNRPLLLKNGFIENIDVAISGNIETDNIELRNTDLNPINGDDNFITSKLVGKIGGFNYICGPILKNCEFGEGLNNFNKNGNVEIVKTNTVYNKYGRVCRITQDSNNISKLMYEFVAERTGYITICVRGLNIGQISCSDGSNSQYALGNTKTNGKYGYSVGRATVTKGNKVLITVYTPAYTDLGTGEVTDLTGFQIFYGKNGENIFDETSYSSLPKHTSNSQNDWKTAFYINYIKGAKTEIEFDVIGNILGQGKIRGKYKSILHIDNDLSLTSTEILKSFIYDTVNGGESAFNIQFVVNSGKIECQFAKGYYGSSANANFIDIKVNNLFNVETIN